MLERVVGGREAGVAVGAEQRQRPHRRLDVAAQPIVDDDPVEAVGVEPRDVLARNRASLNLPWSYRRSPTTTILPSLVVPQPIVAQGFQDRHRPRVAELAERDDRLLFRRETVSAEPGQRIRELIRPRLERQRGEHQKKPDKKDAAADHRTIP